MKKLGQVQTISVDFAAPEPLRHMNLEFNKLNLITGLNNTGKSLILKLVWLLMTSVVYKIAARSRETVGYSDMMGVQSLFDGTFNKQAFTGTCSAVIDPDIRVYVKLEKGKVIDYQVENFTNDLQHQGIPPYLSPETRLLKSIVIYMIQKKTLNISKGMPADETELNKLLLIWRIYDIIHMEQFLLYIENNTTPEVIAKFNEMIKTVDETFQIKDISVDYINNDIVYCNMDGEDKSVTTLGNGHQSMLHMMLFGCYLS